MTDRGVDELGLMIRLLPNQVVLEVVGEVDMATAPDLGCLLGALVDRGHTDVVLNLAKLDFLDSSGLQMIDDTAARLRPSGGVLRIRSRSARPRGLLDVSEVSGLGEFEPSDPDLVPLGSEQQAGDNATPGPVRSHGQPRRATRSRIALDEHGVTPGGQSGGHRPATCTCGRLPCQATGLGRANVPTGLKGLTG